MLENCELPNLPAKYDIALRDAVSFVLDSFKAVGIITSGTIVRGNPDATSDIDLWVIHLEPNRQRIQKFFNSVPVEMIRFAFMNARRFIPRDKDLLEEFSFLACDSAANVQNFFQTSDYDERLRLATKIADEILGVRGFFEWSSSVEVREPPTDRAT